MKHLIPNVTRRGFLRLLGAGTAVASAPTLVRAYQEIDVPIGTPKDWITDHGDFIVVRIPDGKTLARETFDRPTLVWLGKHSEMHDCEINGFVNLYGSDPAIMRNLRIDASKSLTKRVRPVIEVMERTGLQFLDSHVIGTGRGEPWIHFKQSPYSNVIAYNFFR